MQQIIKSPLLVGVISFVLATGFYLSGAAHTLVTSGQSAVLSSMDFAQPPQVAALIKSVYARISEYQRLEFRLSTRMDKLSKRGTNTAKLDGVLEEVRNEIDATLTEFNSAVGIFGKAARFSVAEVKRFITTQTEELKVHFTRIDELLAAALAEIKLLEKSSGN